MPSPSMGLWLSKDEILALANSGKAWDAMRAAASKSWSTPDLGNQDDPTNCDILAGAFVAVRQGDTALAAKVRSAVAKAPETENGGRTLALGRELAAYILAIDLVGWDTDAQEDSFKTWLSRVRRETLDGKTLISTHEVRPNNWGTQAGFSRGAAALYLGDSADYVRCAQVFKGWLGERSSYSGFTYGDLSWQSDPSHPVGINPKGSTIQAHPVDGVLPEEMRRSGDFKWPPPKENYVYTGLAPAYCLAWILFRHGYPDVFQWQDKALLRAWEWLQHVANYQPEGNDLWMAWIVNSVYGTTAPTTAPCPISREIAWVDWTHSIPRGTPPDTDPGPDPEPEPDDFEAAFSLQYLAASKDWAALRKAEATGLAGRGANPDAALADWLAKNPGQLP